jgi:hypothetical protein
MSIENHPNFFASKFIVGLYSLIEDCLRGKGETYKKEVMAFVARSAANKDLFVTLTQEIEEDVDFAVDFAEKGEKSRIPCKFRGIGSCPIVEDKDGDYKCRGCLDYKAVS